MSEPTAADPADPSDPVEQVVAAAFREVFGVARLAPGDDFFTLGGHSMLAVRIAARLRAELDLRVPIRTVLQNPTTGELARALRDAAPDPLRPGPGDPR